MPQQQRRRGTKQRISVAHCRKALCQLQRLLLLPAASAGAVCWRAAGSRLGGSGSGCPALHHNRQAPAHKGVLPRLCVLLLLLCHCCQFARHHSCMMLLLLLLAKHQQHRGTQLLLSCLRRRRGTRCVNVQCLLLLLPAQRHQ